MAPRPAGRRNLSTGAWLRLSLVFIGAVALLALLLDRPAGSGEGPVNYIVFCQASEKGTAGLDLRSVVDEVVLRSIPSVTEIMVVVSVKVDGSGAAYTLEVENPAGGKAVQPLPIKETGKMSSVAQLHMTGFEVDQPGVFKVPRAARREAGRGEGTADLGEVGGGHAAGPTSRDAVNPAILNAPYKSATLPQVGNHK